MNNILKSYSRKIEFGDILKRVQETIRRERAEEKKKKKKKFNDDNKQLSQTQINGKMITELKSEMKRMKEIIETQNDMIKTLIGKQPVPAKDFYHQEGEDGFEESRLSSFAQDNRGMSHNQTLNNQVSMHQNADFHKAATQSHQPLKDDWD